MKRKIVAWHNILDDVFCTWNLPCLKVQLFSRRSTTMHHLIPEMIMEDIVIYNRIRNIWKSGKWKVQASVMKVQLESAVFGSRIGSEIRKLCFTNSVKKQNIVCARDGLTAWFTTTMQWRLRERDALQREMTCAWHADNGSSRRDVGSCCVVVKEWTWGKL